MSGAWANDPWGRFLSRWHDGTTWSEHVSDGRQNGVDPPGPTASARFTPPDVIARPSSDEIIERLVQTAREAIDARAPMSRSAAPPPSPNPSPSPNPAPTREPMATVRPPGAPVPPSTAAPAVSSVQPTVVSAPVSAAASGRTRPPWGWIVAGVAVPVALWCLYNARDNDESVSSGEAPIESAAPTTTTTIAPPVGTIAVASVPPGVTTPLTPPTPDPTLIERCVEFAPFAAYIGDPEMVAFWTAAGFDVSTLRANCTALAPEELDRLSRRKTDMDLFMNGGVVTTLGTIPAVPASVAPPP